ncbi:MAG: hypothetical protein U0703_02750 [Anaerolineae bacterium]
MSSANLRVTLYNRALKPILMTYLARENLRVKNDARRQLCRLRDRVQAGTAVTELERVLTAPA